MGVIKDRVCFCFTDSTTEQLFEEVQVSIGCDSLTAAMKEQLVDCDSTKKAMQDQITHQAQLNESLTKANSLQSDIILVYQVGQSKLLDEIDVQKRSIWRLKIERIVYPVITGIGMIALLISIK
jgi:hypothetical protein